MLRPPELSVHKIPKWSRLASLHAKKYNEGQDLWQARVTGAGRFYFKIVGDTYRMEEIKFHPK